MPDRAVTGQGETKCWSLEETPPHLRDRYRRFALVSHPRHVAGLDPDDADTLIVASDWTVWQDCLARGMHCVNHESGLLEWDGEGLDVDLHIRALDWSYVEGEDATLFEGISLGGQFAQSLFMFITGYKRLEASIKTLTGKYRPQEFIYYDCRTTYYALDEDESRDLIQAIAAEFSIALSDRSDRVPASDCAVPYRPRVFKPAASLIATGGWSLRKFAFSCFERILEAIGRAVRAGRGIEASALLTLTHLNAIPILTHLDGNRVSPTFITRYFPHKRDPKFLFRAIAKGTTFARSRTFELSARERQRIDDIVRRLLDSWRTLPPGVAGAMRRHARKYILEPGLLSEMAREVKYCRWLVDRYRPDCTLTDAFNNPTFCIIAEVARQRGIATGYIWHGLILRYGKMRLLDGDPRGASAISQCLTWGAANDIWLERIGFKGRKVRTGNPIAMWKVKTWPPAIANATRRPGFPETDPRVLILQYAPGQGCVRSLEERQYSSFVAIVRMLRGLGYDDIRLRLHPGAWKVSYLENISDMFALDCPVHVGGPFKDAVDWADFVIGPAPTGAMVETIAAGKPYYPLALAPHSFDSELLAMIEPYTDIQSLERDIESGAVVDQQRILDAFCAVGEIANPARRVWQVVEETALGGM